jgi:hypothetical protein
VAKWLAVGATVGACPPPTPTPTPTPPPAMVTICYEGTELTLIERKVAKWLAVGATVGACP